MARFRQEKDRIARLLARGDWSGSTLVDILGSGTLQGIVAPLFSLLSRPEFRWQAAWCLGKVVCAIAKNNMEEARIILRRITWSLNEESGNLGWGMPESMGCILAECPPLAKEYGHILVSYIHDTGHEDNYIDYAPLRRGAYWAVARLAAADPLRVRASLPLLLAGLSDTDPPCRLFAAFACVTLRKSILGSTNYLPLMAQASASLSICEEFAGEQAVWQQIDTLLTALAQDTAANIDLLDGDAICSYAVSPAN